jgi:hypothetical protein
MNPSRRADPSRRPGTAILESAVTRARPRSRRTRRPRDGDLGDDGTRDLLLLAGELVTDSLLHARADGSHEMTLEPVLGCEAGGWRDGSDRPGEASRVGRLPGWGLGGGGLALDGVQHAGAVLCARS